MKRPIVALLIALAVGALVTLAVIKVVGDRPDACQGKPVSCLDGR